MQEQSVEVVQQSYLTWIIGSLGLPYLLLLPLAGIASFLVAAVVVSRGKGPMAAAALILVVPAPLLLGVFAALTGCLSALQVIATSPSAPRPDLWAQAVSTSLVAPMVGLMVMTPGFVVAAIGSFLRAVSPNQT